MEEEFVEGIEAQENERDDASDAIQVVSIRRARTMRAQEQSQVSGMPGFSFPRASRGGKDPEVIAASRLKEELERERILKASVGFFFSRFIRKRCDRPSNSISHICGCNSIGRGSA